MKTKLILILSVVISNALYSNGVSDYFPLRVGNVWSYNWIFNGKPSGGGRINVSVTKDTIFNSKKYYLCNFPNLPQWLRVDSLSGNIYGYSSNGGCSYNPGENLIDSLLSKKYDSTNYCGFVRRICSDTGKVILFGNTYSKKDFNPLIVLTASSRSYAKNIGLFFLNEGDPATTNYALRGCVINGVVYGDTTLTGNHQINSVIPAIFSLSQNYPNPFNPVTKIKLDIPVGRIANPFYKLTVYDALGKEVATLINEELSPGTYEVEFNGQNLSSGIYFYHIVIHSDRLQTQIFNEVKRMILIK